MAKTLFPARKMAPPAPREVLVRERLTRLFDAREPGEIVWVEAPAGYGKTTLVSRLVATRYSHRFWYRLEEEDNDPATLFQFCRDSVIDLIGKSGDELGLFKVEFQGNPIRFARDYADGLNRIMPRNAVVVLDDYHELAPGSSSGAMLAEVSALLREDILTIVVGRIGPTSDWASVRVTRGIHHIPAADLAFTPEETQQLASMMATHGEPKLTLAEAEQLVATTGGWVSGLMLVLRSGRTALEPTDRDLREQIFSYYAAVLFDAADEATQRLLLCTAWLPVFNADMVERILGITQAAAQLEQLYTQNYFLERSSFAQGAYRFHTLFKDFLQETARARMAPAEQQRISLLAGDYYRAKGEPDLAMQVYAELDDEAPTVDLIEKNAADLFDQGRWQTLLLWLEGVPEEWRQVHPWLAYWYGLCQRNTDTVGAQASLESAYYLFQSRRHVEGQYLAWAGVVETIIFRFGGFSELAHWISEMDRLRTNNPFKVSLKTRLRVDVTLFTTLLLSDPAHPWLPKLEKKLNRILLFAPKIEHRLLVGAHLMRKHMYSGDVAAAAVLFDRLRSNAEKRTIDPFSAMVWRSTQAMYRWMGNSPEDGLRAVEEGLAAAQEYGIHLMDMTLLLQGAFSAFTKGDWRLASTYIERMPAAIREEQHIHFAALQFMRGWIDICKGDYPAARDRMLSSGELIEEMDSKFQLTIQWWGLSMAHALCGEREKALNLIDRTLEISLSFNFGITVFMAGLAKAQILLHSMDEAGAIESLRSALQFGKQKQLFNALYFNHEFLAELFALAFREDVETDYVLAIIRRIGLKPLGLARQEPRWPWPLRVRTFGGLSIEVNERQLEIGKKIPKQPLNLLKLLAVHRAQSLSTEEIGLALWPDIPVTNHPSTLKTTLSRLRKLVGRDSIVQQEGRLKLNPECVWSDAASVDLLVHQQVDNLNVSQLKTLSQRLQSVYRGMLLPEDDHYWVLAARERMHVGFTRLINRLVERTLALGEHDVAINVCLFGIEVDPLAEGFYRGLMQTHIALGQHGEAVRVYRRCQQILNSRLAIEPAPETRALYAQLVER